MAKKQSFGDKVARRKADVKKMAKIIVAEKKPNGSYRFREKVVELDSVSDELKAARS